MYGIIVGSLTNEGLGVRCRDKKGKMALRLSSSTRSC
jgi:hypothetical protein